MLKLRDTWYTALRGGAQRYGGSIRPISALRGAPRGGGEFSRGKRGCSSHFAPC
jgi:hypothetical protein